MDKLTERRNSLITEIEALAKTTEDEVRSFNEEEEKRYNEIMEEIKGLNKQIERAKEIRNLEISKGNENNPNSEKDEIRAFDNMLRTIAGGKTETRANITYGDNGAIIPTSIMPKIIDKVVNISPLFAAATKYSVKGDITIPYVNTADGDITVAFADEFSTLTASSIKFSSITLKGYLAAALVLVSKQMINNTNFNIVDFVINYIAKKIAIFTENYLIKGDSTKNAKSGLANSVTQKTEITAANGFTADTLVAVQDTIPDAYQSSSFWLMSPGTRSVIRSFKDGQGNYLLIPDYSKSSSGWSLLGKPVYVTDNLSDVSEASEGENFLYYGDFSGLAVKTGETAEIQVLNEKYAEQHAVGLNVWFEIDSTVEDGQKITALGIKNTT